MSVPDEPAPMADTAADDLPLPRMRPTTQGDPMTDQRTDRYADAIYDVVVDHPMWIGDDGKPLDYLPERATRLLECVYQAAAAVIALADAEVDDPTEGYTLCGLSACHMIGTCQARSGCEYATAAEDGAR